MSDNGNNLREMVKQLLFNQEQALLTEKQLQDMIVQVRTMPMCQVEDPEADAIFKELVAIFSSPRPLPKTSFKL